MQIMELVLFRSFLTVGAEPFVGMVTNVKSMYVHTYNLDILPSVSN